MKLTEIKTKHVHYFTDEQGRKQGECKTWHDNGQQRVICHFRDDIRHGEYKTWHDNGQQSVICHFRDDEYHGECKSWNSTGRQCHHAFDINGKEIIDFLKNPELYPETPEEKTMLVLKYGSAPFIGDKE